MVSFRFPPYQSIGAVRVGKTARYLAEFGHDVRVLSASHQPLPKTLPLEIPAAHVTYTPWFNVNRGPELALGGRERVAARGYQASGPFREWLRGLGKVYKKLVNIPDGQVGWIPYALRAGFKMTEHWSPDVVFASAMPFSSLIVGATLARRRGVPFVAELRDLWVESPYYEHGAWRRVLDGIVERAVLRRAAGHVTVSAPLAATLQRSYRKPTQVVLNGFDPADWTGTAEPPHPGEELHIVYTGMIYPGKRDPAPLFDALHRLGSEGNRVRVDFYGRYQEDAQQLLARHPAGHLARFHPAVTHSESLAIQARADVLLLLLWDSPEEKGVFTGKLFEYVGARRPILVIGPADNVAAELVVSRGLGHAGTEPGKIEEVLRGWLREKRERGLPEPPPASAAAGLSRETQTRVLEGFLLDTADRGQDGR